MLDADELLQAIFLKGHLACLAAGMANSRMSGREILAKASRLTGTQYRRGQYSRALADLRELVGGQGSAHQVDNQRAAGGPAPGAGQSS